eukprot:CAMPEP_0183513308 /NCGR_PEP_ID=MMETSP0371-20130417/12114_1 /TAXON_ID=268820 /ORGANISM="Peridinium aciculiferum, Strain PAER-2" /LENGTH=70 /DNA_ID=CAMNT_0025710519 /DNA_START=534 /DNA_END=746 /DNA_ORIENTATION=+
MSSNLFSSHRSGASFKYFGVPQVQQGRGSEVTESCRLASHLANSAELVGGGCGNVPQMLACWLTQKAQIQ